MKLITFNVTNLILKIVILALNIIPPFSGRQLTRIGNYSAGIYREPDGEDYNCDWVDTVLFGLLSVLLWIYLVHCLGSAGDA